MNDWINLGALWRIVVIGLVCGAGLPALFAVGLKAVAAAEGDTTTPDGGGTAAVRDNGCRQHCRSCTRNIQRMFLVHNTCLLACPAPASLPSSRCSHKVARPGPPLAGAMQHDAGLE